MRIDVKEAVKLLEKNDNIIILVHSNPDGDTLGCGYALLRALRKQGKKAEALKVYNEIKEKYFASLQAMDIEKYINRVK